MTRQLSMIVVGLAVALGALPAEARFGKKSSSNPPESKSHEAEAVNAPSDDPGSSGGSYSAHRGQGRRYGGGRYGYGYGYGYWSGAFVPWYGFGYAAPVVVVVEAGPRLLPPEPEPEPAGVRLLVGIEGQGYRGGVTLGATVGVEGDRWGFFASGQNIAIEKDDGTKGYDHLQVATAHGTFAFLTGRQGRMRFELGADAVFAPNLIVVGPTGGLSGTLWLFGPLALEGSAMVTPWPYLQFDGKIGLALGLGPVGIRAGLRAQLLDDRGLVDGVIHQDTFLGPYLGVSMVF